MHRAKTRWSWKLVMLQVFIFKKYTPDNNTFYLCLIQDFPEVASHQDSLPEFLGFMNQSSQLGTMKGAAPSRISISPSGQHHQNKRHSCPPIPFHLQQQKQGSPGGWHHGSPMGKQYSPVHTIRSSPHHHSGNAHHESNTLFESLFFKAFYKFVSIINYLSAIIVFYLNVTLCEE